MKLGCIPLHVIASRADALDRCDFLTLDLEDTLSRLGAMVAATGNPA